MTNRYDASGSLESQYQPGSFNTVLCNRLGIIDSTEMDSVELELFELRYEEVLSSVNEDQLLTVAELSEWHRMWLGNVYAWAGQERAVNMAKGEFHFAAVTQIPRLMDEIDRKYLSVYTPCQGFTEEQLVEAIAIVHVELILVPPFREGNGRLSRLLANVIALQAGWPELDFSCWDAAKEEYFKAIQAGMYCDYEPLKILVRQVLSDSEKVS